MPKLLPLSASLLCVWLLQVSSAHAGPFEECDSGEDFEFSPNRWSPEDQDRIFRGCNEFIKQVSQDAKKLAIAYTNRGNVYFNKLEWEKAIADFTNAIGIDPSNADAYYRRANAFGLTDCPLLTGRGRCSRERAFHDYDKAIEIDPRHRWAYGRRAFVYEAWGNFDRAIADRTKHIEMNPKDAVRGHWGRAKLYHRMKDYDRAIADYTKVIELDPPVTDLPEGILQIVPNYNGYRARADTYFDKKDYDRAITDYTKIMEIFDRRTMEHQRAYRWRVRARAERGDFDYAIAEYTKMIAASPANAMALSERARIYFRIGKTSQALADAEKAMELARSLVKREPDGAWAFDIRGHVHETLGKRDEAIADYRRALKLNAFQAEWSENGLRRLGVEP